MAKGRGNSKADTLIALLAGGVYRQWWWANFKSTASQATFREMWAPTLARLEMWQIKQGFAKWVAEHGESEPPTPDAFAAFVMPVHTPASRAGFAGIKAILLGG